jgi:glycosyltransferase involved in cell wall biosynthesis/predicted O-methyltransferase YrrM
MRLALLNTFDLAGGAAQATFRLHLGLHRIGFAHRFYVARKDGDDPGITPVRPLDDAERADWQAKEAAIRGEEAPYPAFAAVPFAPFHSDRAARADLLEARMAPCDVYHLHWVRGLVDWRHFFTHRTAEQAVIWTLHDQQPFTGGCHYPGTSGDTLCQGFRAACGGCPVLGSIDPSDLSALTLQRKQAALASFKGVLRAVSPSHWLAREAASSSLLARTPIEVIPNSVDALLFRPQPLSDAMADQRRALAHPLVAGGPEALVVGFVAQNLDDPRKGLDLLTAALDRLAPDLPLALATAGGGGDGKGHSGGGARAWRRLDLGLADNDPEALAQAYALCDIIVIPSRQDNLPNTALEAMACGKPIIGFASGGLPDLVIPGVTGWLATPARRVAGPDGARALIDSLAQTLALAYANRARLSAMGAAARARVEAEHLPERQALRYLRLYEQALDDARKAAPAAVARPRAQADFVALSPYHRRQIIGMTKAYGGIQALSLATWDFLSQAQRKAGIAGDCLEIGVFEGAGAAALLSLSERESTYLGIDIAPQEAAVKARLASFAPNLADRCRIIAANSRHLVGDEPDLKAGSYRLLHIDGEHSSPAVTHDLALCARLMALRGIVIVDDVTNPASVCIAQATFDFLRQPDCPLRLFLWGGGKAYLCRPEGLDFYRRACMGLPGTPGLADFVLRHYDLDIFMAQNSEDWSLDVISFGLREGRAPYIAIGRHLPTPFKVP